MDYYNYRIHTDPENVEVLLAFLAELPFDSFQEMEYGLDAYLPADLLDQSIENQVVELQRQIQFSFEKEKVAARNWNAVWESNFDPIIVGDFCTIRADFHPPEHATQHEILINPKMAFGTGHHETTFMVIQTMKDLDFSNKKVLDYGCGTGILAILASKLGAREIIAVDIEFQSYENTIENAQQNGISNVQAIHGTLKNIDDIDFDILLANINRNVILDTIGALYKKLLKNGKLIVSGILIKDEALLSEHAEDTGFAVKHIIQKNNWICCQFEK